MKIPFKTHKVCLCYTTRVLVCGFVWWANQYLESICARAQAKLHRGAQIDCGLDAVTANELAAIEQKLKLETKTKIRVCFCERVCLCVYVRACACMWERERVFARVCFWWGDHLNIVFAWICVSCVRERANMRICACMCFSVCMCPCTRTYVCVCMYVYDCLPACRCVNVKQVLGW